MAEEQVSEFNMHLAFLYTLREILNRCNDASSILNVGVWYSALLALNRELNPYMTVKQKNEVKAYKKYLHPLIMSHMGNRIRNKGNVTQQLYDSLDDLEVFHREIIEKKGFNTRMESGASHALRGGH